VMNAALEMYTHLFQNQVAFPLTIFYGEQQHRLDLVEDSWENLYKMTVKNPRALFFDRIQQIEITRMSDGYVHGPSANCETALSGTTMN
jgi:hypothetical protein